MRPHDRRKALASALIVLDPTAAQRPALRLTKRSGRQTVGIAVSDRACITAPTVVGISGVASKERRDQIKPEGAEPLPARLANTFQSSREKIGASGQSLAVEAKPRKSIEMESSRHGPW